jgi:AcrR family transcriptional regulator
MEAARSVFTERGLDTTTIHQITERADVGKGTFYYHFKGKEGLIRELVRETLSELNQAINERCRDQQDLGSLLDTLISAHIEFFSNRWEDFILYFQSRADLTLEIGYEGIETPFVEYLELIERHVDAVIKSHPPKPVLRRMACAVAGFVSGYYSFAAVASKDADIDATFRTLRGAMVASLTRFIIEATPTPPGGQD